MKSQEYSPLTIVVGSGRSGTTYLAQALLHGLGLSISGEVKFIVPLYRKISQFGDLKSEHNLRKLVNAIHNSNVFVHMHNVRGIPSSEEEILARVKEPTYTGVVYATLQLLAEKSKTTRLSYKNPQDVLHMPLLAELMPSARFVHIIRDGRDVALSMLKFRWGPTNLYAGVRYWRNIVKTGQENGRSLDGRYHELRFEDLILDTENTATDLSRFINQGEDSQQESNLIDWVNQTKKVDSVNIWQNQMNHRQRYLCEAVGGDILRQCNYLTEFDPLIHISSLKKDISLVLIL